jgi:hypothetical protein
MLIEGKDKKKKKKKKEEEEEEEYLRYIPVQQLRSAKPKAQDT